MMRCVTLLPVHAAPSSLLVGLRYDVFRCGSSIRITMTTQEPESPYAVCGEPSRRVHSRYVRRLAKRPISCFNQLMANVQEVWFLHSRAPSAASTMRSPYQRFPIHRQRRPVPHTCAVEASYSLLRDLSKLNH